MAMLMPVSLEIAMVFTCVAVVPCK